MKVGYEIFTKAWVNFYYRVHELARLPQIKKVCEIGGGANPFLKIDFVQEQGLQYTIMDISAEELKKAPDGYHKLEVDITSYSLRLTEKYDLVFSHQLAEHVKDGTNFHKNIMHLLNDNGYAFHFFPTLYAPPFILNRILPTDIAYSLVLWHDPSRRKEGNVSKFPAYYHLCKGPTKMQIKMFENMGFSVEEYMGFFGHDYYESYKPLKQLSNLAADFLLKHPIPQLTSYAYVLLSKQAQPVQLQ